MRNLTLITLGFALSLVVCTAQANSESNAFLEGAELADLRSRFTSTNVANPFREGVEKVVLTEEEKKSLKAFADNAKSNLQRALDKAEGKTLEESNAIYQAAIVRVVLDSYEDSKRSELLMRYILNQALQLTVGIPTPDGRSIETPGVLARVSNSDVITVILEDSIRLAINFYKNDRQAIEMNELVKLPYIEMATRRMALAEEWIASVHEWNLQLDMQIAVAEQWLTTVAGEGELRRIKIGEAILEIDDALNQVTDLESPYSVLQKVRFLRGKFRWLRRELREAGFSLGAVLSSPYGSSSDGYSSEMLVVTDMRAVDNVYLYRAENSWHTDFIIGLGYSGHYYYRDANSQAGGKYDLYTHAEFIELMRNRCESMRNNMSSYDRDGITGYACAPANGIFQAPMKLTNEEFGQLAQQISITLYVKR